ncbi:MAG: D-alanine--D-alanine ligase A, partial [Limisphaerales bacterium]
MPKKIRLGILFGGRSGEHEVSLESAASVVKAIDRDKYEVVPIGITREGRWVLGDAPAEPSSKTLAGVFQNGKEIAPPADPTRK